MGYIAKFIARADNFVIVLVLMVVLYVVLLS